MHQSSLELMQELLAEHVTRPVGKTVLDVGSFAVGHTYRPMCESLGLQYTGCDIQPGDNVDLVIPELGVWDIGKFDIVISGQCLEHVRMPWIWIRQLAATVATGGTVILVAPWVWRIHRYPVDCWRFLPDGMAALLEWGGLQCIATGIGISSDNVPSNDCYGIGTKI